MKKTGIFGLHIVALLSISISLESNGICGFENYFKEMVSPNGDTRPAEAKIEKAMHSIVSRIQLPYVGEDGHMKTDGFFEKVEKKIHEKDPQAKAYVAGGVVRSLLGYIYKKI